jgi:hypothetical protein
MVSTLDLLAIIGMIATPTAIALGVALHNARKELDIRRELMRYPIDRNVGVPETGRLEQAVDAIAVEVERITEGQRFMAKLLAERSSDRMPDRSILPSSEHRVVTPH